MRSPRGVWYLVPVALFLLCGGIAARSCVALRDRIVGMQRVVMPGEAEVTLEAGDHVVYFEHVSEVDGHIYNADTISLRCAMADPDGAPVALESPTGSTSYTMFGFSGKSAFELTAPRDGVYRLACEGDSGPSVLAVGDGIGWPLILTVLAAIGAIALPGVALAILLTRRWKARRAAPMPMPLGQL